MAVENNRQKPDLTKPDEHGTLKVRISHWTEENPETKYCGEVIGDGVQL